MNEDFETYADEELEDLYSRISNELRLRAKARVRTMPKLEGTYAGRAEAVFAYNRKHKCGLRQAKAVVDFYLGA